MHNWVARYAGKAEGGTGCGLPNALLLQCNDADVYWRIKVGRPEWAKVPLLIKPHAALYLIDFSLVHPAYRHLRHREAFARLWEAPGAPLHVIAPLKQPLRFLHPAFQTSGEDLRRQAADAQTTGRLIGVSTASFFWMADRAWDAFATLLGLSPATVLRRWRAGELPGYRLASNVLRFSESDLEHWLADRRAAPPCQR